MVRRTASADELFYRGTRLMNEGSAQEAEDAFRTALQIAPSFAEAHANLGLLLERTGRWQEAETHYLAALELQPGQLQTLLNFGAMLTALKRFAEAEAIYRQALAVDPGSHGAWSNLGVLLACTKREEDAEQCYRTAMAIAPDYAKARFNLAYLLLRQGRYEEGWARLESREWYTPLEAHWNCPRWRGESLQGKSLLIGFEAGHGDMIQFCRYAALAKESGAARVAVLCHPGLKNLFERLHGVDQVFSFNEPAPSIAWDFWTPPLSMPFLFQTQLHTIPARLPYLSAAPERIDFWAGIMKAGQGTFRIGLAWKGNPRFENDAERSLPSLMTLAPLRKIDGIRWFSLQKGPGEGEAARLAHRLPLVDLAPRIEDFADTAAIIMNLDLVIAVDTAVAHLAGALGKPCWVLLPDYKTDWRWLTECRDSPWYPGVMRLFRQRTMGDWEPVIADVTSALQTLLSQERH
jgi:hypothetical protein